MCSRLVLTSYDDRAKFKLISNRHLAARGRNIPLDRYIRSRTAVFAWGDCSVIR